MTKKTLNVDQRKAINRYVADNGRGWKLKLSIAWITGIYVCPDCDVIPLQQLSSFGPDWLASFRRKR